MEHTEVKVNAFDYKDPSKPTINILKTTEKFIMDTFTRCDIDTAKKNSKNCDDIRNTHSSSF